MSDLNHSTIEEAVNDEKASSKKLTRHQRQARRFELSNPSNVSKRLCSLIAERFPPELICDKLEELLEATITAKDGSSKPDNRARESACKILLAYSVGLPVQRSEHVEVRLDATAGEVQEQLRQSPALRSQLQRMLGQAEDA